MVVAGELLYDGDGKPGVARPTAQRLIGVTVLRPGKDESLEGIPLLAAKLDMDWRWRDQKWKRMARLVARDFASARSFSPHVGASHLTSKTRA